MKSNPKPKPSILTSKKKQIRNMRESAMVNPDGSRESHRMAWVGDESKKRGKFGVFPTITPKQGKEKSTNPSDWTTQSPKQAAEKGEMIEVRSRRKAEKLAAGSWKQGQDRKDAMKSYRAEKRESNPSPIRKVVNKVLKKK
jgi:hypothetical protein